MTGFPTIRLFGAVTRPRPADHDSEWTLALDSVESWTGRLTEDPWVETESLGKVFRNGDLLFGKLRPYLAKVWAADRDGDYIGDFIRMTPRRTYDVNFLRYVMLTPEFIDAAVAMSYGSKMPRTEWEQLRDVPIPAPSLDEQRRIADYLDQETAEIDVFIDCLGAMKELSRERFNALVRWRLAANGSNVPLRRVATLITGSTPPGKNGGYGQADLPWFRPGDVDLLSRVSAARGGVTAAEANGLPIVSKNSPFIVGIGATIGRVGFSEEDFTTNQQLTAVVPIDIDPIFLYYALRAGSDWIRQNASGTTLPIINNQTLGAMPIPRLEWERQRCIAQELDSGLKTLRQVLKEADDAISLARERRAALISTAVTGKLDVTSKEAVA